MKKVLPVLLISVFLFSFCSLNKEKVELSHRDFCKVQMRLGVYALKNKLYKEALFRFKKVLEYRKDDYRLLNNIAVCYEALGERKLADFYYRKALLLSRNNFKIKENYERFKTFFRKRLKKGGNFRETKK